MDQYTNDRENSSLQQPSPHRMNRRAIIIAITLFALIVIGMFTFAFLKKNELQEGVVSETQEQPSAEVKYASITRVDAKHYFIDGVHTLAGEILMPTPCDLLDSSAVVMESFPEQVSIDFNVINNANFCEEQTTPQRFKISVPASEGATFRAAFMGRTVDLNLIPAAEGEVPDDFELFIKG
jgi:hypothetical protein